MHVVSARHQRSWHIKTNKKEYRKLTKKNSNTLIKSNHIRNIHLHNTDNDGQAMFEELKDVHMIKWVIQMKKVTMEVMKHIVMQQQWHYTIEEAHNTGKKQGLSIQTIMKRQHSYSWAMSTTVAYISCKEHPNEINKTRVEIIVS